VRWKQKALLNALMRISLKKMHLHKWKMCFNFVFTAQSEIPFPSPAFYSILKDFIHFKCSLGALCCQWMKSYAFFYFMMLVWTNNHHLAVRANMLMHNTCRFLVLNENFISLNNVFCVLMDSLLLLRHCWKFQGMEAFNLILQSSLMFTQKPQKKILLKSSTWNTF
jgi:hypothetical protein